MPDLKVVSSIGIVLVVLGHSLPAPEDGVPLVDMAFYLRRVIYTFHMPLFFFVSGFLLCHWAKAQEASLGGRTNFVPQFPCVLARQAAVLARPHDPLGLFLAGFLLGFSKTLKDVTLAIGNDHHLRIRNLVRHFTAAPIALQPAETFLVFNRFLLLLSLACLSFWFSRNSSQSRAQMSASTTPNGTRSGVTANMAWS